MTDDEHPDEVRVSDNVARQRLLAGAEELPPGHRSLLLETATRLLYPSMLLVSVYLLVVGLQSPGGGFAAGLVLGMALLLRRLAGGPRELGTAVAVPPGILLGTGLTVVAGYSLAGIVLSGTFLKSTVLTVHPPLLGAFEVPTSLVFELGMVLIVVGLVLDVLRTLGEQVTEE